MNKFSEFSSSVDTLNPSVIGITETWLRPDINDIEIKLNAYEAFRCDRELNNGGGALLFIHKQLKSKPCNELNNLGFEDSVWRLVCLNKEEQLLVGVVYRSPNCTANNDEKLLQLFEKVKTVKNVSHILIMGDFNFPAIKWQEGYVAAGSNSISSRFFDLSNDLFLIQHVNCNTRFRDNQEPSLLDLVFTNDDCFIDNIDVLPPLGKSDHVALNWIFHCSSEIDFSSGLIDRLSYDKADYQEMNDFFHAVDWEDELNSSNIEDCWSSFKLIYKECVDRYIPVKKCKSSTKAPWFRKKVKEAVRKKHLLFRKQRTSKRYVDIQAYKRQCAVTDKIIKGAKSEYESDIMKSFKAKPKKFYNYLRSKQKVKVGVPDLEKDDGSFTQTDSEISEVLSKFFSSVFTHESNDKPLPDFGKRCEVTLESVNITEDKVLKKLQSLKSDKSQGLDKIHPRVLRECSISLVKPLTMLYRKSICEGQLPLDWRSASITPIFKKGSRVSAGNYRPVSLTSVPCKVLESIIREDMLSHLESHKLIAEEQHGFVKNKSCLTNLLETLDDVTSALDSGEGLDMVFLDYKKAFDSVPHQRLVHKLKSYGFGDRIIQWVANFLNERK